MANSFIRTTTTIIGVMLLGLPAHGWMRTRDPLAPQQASSGWTAVGGWQPSERTISDSAGRTAEASVPFAALWAARHQQDLRAAAVSRMGAGQSASQTARFLDDPKLLVPVYALQGRARWCHAPEDFVFCDHWSAPYNIPLHFGRASGWHMCSCDVVRATGAPSAGRTTSWNAREGE